MCSVLHISRGLARFSQIDKQNSSQAQEALDYIKELLSVAGSPGSTAAFNIPAPPLDSGELGMYVLYEYLVWFVP